MQRYVIFVRDYDVNCLGVFHVIQNCQWQFQTISIDRLPTVPRWLRGVPSLLDRDTGVLYEGTECLNHVKQVCQDTYVNDIEEVRQTFVINPNHIFIMNDVPVPDREEEQEVITIPWTTTTTSTAPEEVVNIVVEKPEVKEHTSDKPSEPEPSDGPSGEPSDEPSDEPSEPQTTKTIADHVKIDILSDESDESDEDDLD